MFSFPVFWNLECYSTIIYQKIAFVKHFLQSGILGVVLWGSPPSTKSFYSKRDWGDFLVSAFVVCIGIFCRGRRPRRPVYNDLRKSIFPSADERLICRDRRSRCGSVHSRSDSRSRAVIHYAHAASLPRRPAYNNPRKSTFPSANERLNSLLQWEKGDRLRWMRCQSSIELLYSKK